MSRRVYCESRMASHLFGRLRKPFSLLGSVLVAHYFLTPSARACDVNNPEVHRSGNLVWCADPGFWSAHSASVKPFFSFADSLLPKIQEDFGVASTETFYIVVNAPNGGASTPTPYGPGVNVSGDSFYNVTYGISGFYGYLFIAHEFVNQWTGLAIGGGGWPTDWWANHRSPFPNAIDPILLGELGQTQAAAAQLARFVPGGDSADVQVPLFTGLFNEFGGWKMLQKYFDLLRSDGLRWGELRDPPDYVKQTAFVSGNPSRLLADYVVAYFNLVIGQDVQARFDTAGVGTRPPNWAAETAFPTYHLNLEEISNIASAHCLLLNADSQAVSTQSAARSFQSGNYQATLSTLRPQGSCGPACVSECGCDEITHLCTPRFLKPTLAAGASPASSPKTAPTESSPVLPQAFPAGVAYYAGGCQQGAASLGLESLIFAIYLLQRLRVRRCCPERN